MSDISLEIHHLDVRGGDSTAIIVKDMTQEAGGKTIYRVLIDAGAEGKGSAALKSYLTTYLPGAFDLIVATHYHQDHIQGFSQAAIEFKSYLDNGAYADGSSVTFDPRNDIGAGARTTIFESYKTRVQKMMFDGPNNQKQKAVRVEIPFIKKGFDLKKAKPVEWELGDKTGIKLICYCANGILANGKDVLGDQKKNKNKAISPNDVSLVLLLEWGDFRYLTAGDLSGDTEQSSYYDIEKSMVDYLVEQLGDKKISVFKASHHGSEHSNQTYLFEKLEPKTIVVCCNVQKQVPSPMFLKRLKKYFKSDPKATVVFTNTMKLFKNDDRYAPLLAVKNFIAKGNVDFREENNEQFATNLGIKCAVIRRRVANGVQQLGVDEPDQVLDLIEMTNHEIVLMKRKAEDEKEVSETVKFASFDMKMSWQNILCGDENVKTGFTEQASEMIRWLAADETKKETVGLDYITEHYPGLVKTLEEPPNDTRQERLVQRMLVLFNTSFKLDKSKSPYLWHPTLGQLNTLTGDEKKTIYNLLMSNSHQVIFNKAITQNQFKPARAWNVLEDPEPHPIPVKTDDPGAMKRLLDGEGDPVSGKMRKRGKK